MPSQAVRFVRVFADRHRESVDGIQAAGEPVFVPRPGEEKEVEAGAVRALMASGGDWR